MALAAIVLARIVNSIARLEKNNFSRKLLYFNCNLINKLSKAQKRH